MYYGIMRNIFNTWSFLYKKLLQKFTYFLRKIVKGGTDESYGVHVARLAGVPKEVTKRANEILRGLERKSVLGKKNLEKENKKVATGQLDMYNYKLAELAHEIDKINLNELTPIDALNILVKMKDKIK